MNEFDAKEFIKEYPSYPWSAIIEKAYRQGRADERKKLLAWLSEKGYLNRVDIDYDWEECSYEVVNALSVEEVVEEYMEQMEKDGV